MKLFYFLKTLAVMTYCIMTECVRKMVDGMEKVSAMELFKYLH